MEIFKMSDKKRFQEICEVCPEIEYLDWFTKQFAGREGFCANAILFSYLKPVINELVGWHSENVLLRSSRDYDIVFQTLYHNLPDCRHEDRDCRWQVPLWRWFTPKRREVA